MTKEEIKQLQEQIEVLKDTIKILAGNIETKNIARLLSINTNTYLHKLLLKAMCEKDEKGEYVHQAN